MRLAILDNGHSVLQKIQLWLMGRMISPVPGPIKTLSYRREFFGKSMAEVIHQAMRDTTEWSVSEVELFAAFVSDCNRCRF